MTCQPERVTGFVDGVLDDDARVEMEAHLAECDACRSQAAAEVEIKKRIGALPRIELPAGLESAVRRRLAPRRPLILRTLLPLAATLVAAFAWARGSAPFVAWELARDHNHCFSQARLPAEVWSNDARTVTGWFAAHGRVLPYLPSKVGPVELVGARRCPLLDRSVAHLYYEGGDHRVSVFVVPGAVRFDDLTYAARSRGLAVRLVRVSGSVVGLVAQHDEEANAFEGAFMTTVASASFEAAPSSLP
jgi:anti-sigma factor RsiW